VSSFLSDHADSGRVALRVSVQAGGCAGFRYALFFDDRQLDGDTLSVQHGVALRAPARRSI
jgi:iron-sulfur cluster assembly protein